MSTCVLEHHGQPEESQVYVLLSDALSLCVIVFGCFIGFIKATRAKAFIQLFIGIFKL